VGETRGWEVEELHARLEHEQGPAALQIIRNFAQRLDARYSGSDVGIQWGGSRDRMDKYATLCPYFEYDQTVYRLPVCFRVDGKVEVPFWSFKRVPGRWNTYHDYETIRTPFYEEEKRRELRDRLNGVPGINLNSRSLNGRPTFPLSLLADKNTFDKLVEVFGWYVSQIVPHEQRSGTNQEVDRRRGMCETLLHAGGPKGVAPGVLRDLGIYGGAQGVWVDKARTGSLTEDATGVTVGLLHTGSSYADDLSDDGVIYHYPNTNRPRGRDLAEIEATKAAGRLGLPVFVIT
jgi:hypothetical protein